MEISVWAPFAERVELDAAGSRIAMEASTGGWWRVEADLEHGNDYSFVVDGAGPFPDPRSPWQPHGVDGPSRVYEHDRFRWTVHSWEVAPFEEWIIYELHIGTFTPEGTFDAAIERLDHLVHLGVNAVEICPVNEFSGDHGWGYDGVDLFAPHHAYGGPDGLKRFVDACHARGLSVILDVVYNHLGPSGNYLGMFGPYFTDAYSTPWGDAVNFDDAHSDEVRGFFIDNAAMWFEHYRFDGLRLDAVHAMLDQSAIHFLEEIRMHLDDVERRLGRTLHLIAESDLGDPRVIRPRADHGWGMRAQWSDDFHHALHAVLTGERAGYYEDFGRLADLAKAIEQAFVYDFRYSPHRRRRHGRRPEGLPGDRFLAYMQNHDQVGNRATGERISHLVSPELVKIGAALVLTSPFVPMLFAGEEWAASTPFQYFTDHADPELGRAVSEGRRSEFASFGWDPSDVPGPQDAETFFRSKLKWEEVGEPQHGEMLEWYRALLRLRRDNPGLRASDLSSVRVTSEESEGWLLVEREGWTIACNFSAGERQVPAPSPGRLVLSSPSSPKGSGGKVVLPPHAVAIWES